MKEEDMTLEKPKTCSSKCRGQFSVFIIFGVMTSRRQTSQIQRYPDGRRKPALTTKLRVPQLVEIKSDEYRSGKCGRNFTLAGAHTHGGTATVQHAGAPQKEHRRDSKRPAATLLGTHLMERDMHVHTKLYVHVRDRAAHNSPEVQPTKMS